MATRVCLSFLPRLAPSSQCHRTKLEHIAQSTLGSRQITRDACAVSDCAPASVARSLRFWQVRSRQLRKHSSFFSRAKCALCYVLQLCAVTLKRGSEPREKRKKKHVSPSFIAHRFNRTLRTLKAHSFGQWNLDSHRRSQINITLDRASPGMWREGLSPSVKDDP